ncbi:MAG TPA: RsmD family RNA methyltransferase [Candidatus Paceibacterota bacterium]|jgi:23S rRNA (cytosine1962-C5)-methyltransferase|nr:RsmD family RNA methyltransferase [Candidatus Paceibacterota bacterium]
MKKIDVTVEGWQEYKLLDSGEGRRLELFGRLVLDRPDPQALWQKSHPEKWQKADAQFIWADKGDRWSVTKGTPEEWVVSWQDMKLNLSFKGFKHIGIFPEHSKQWEQFQSLGKKHAGLRMLNLFGYTGAASIAAAQAGMIVTHVDASKQTIETVKENAKQSGLSNDALRTVVEDALRYAKRLVQREEQFEVIVMDPPAFGRGPKGEVWKIEEKLQELTSILPQLLSKDAKLVILNGYSSGFSSQTFAELLKDVLPHGSISHGEIAIAQEERQLVTGIYASWQDQ